MILRNYNIFIAYTLTFLSCGTIFAATDLVKLKESRRNLHQITAEWDQIIAENPLFRMAATSITSNPETDKDALKKNRLLIRAAILTELTENKRDQNESTIISLLQNLGSYLEVIEQVYGHNNSYVYAVKSMQSILHATLGEKHRIAKTQQYQIKSGRKIEGDHYFNYNDNTRTSIETGNANKSNLMVNHNGFHIREKNSHPWRSPEFRFPNYPGEANNFYSLAKEHHEVETLKTKQLDNDEQNFLAKFEATKRECSYKKRLLELSTNPITKILYATDALPLQPSLASTHLKIEKSTLKFPKLATLHYFDKVD